MLISHILTIVERDLNKLKEELHLYRNETDIWQIAPGTSNSAGTLALHLVGNLRHFIGSVLGNSGYIRERDLEFSLRDIKLNELDKLIESAKSEVRSALTGLDSSKLAEAFPKEFGGMKFNTTYALLHLMSHLGYHLGQVNYHRRMVTSAGT